MSLNDGVCKGSPLWGSPFSILPNTPDTPGGKWFFDEFSSKHAENIFLNTIENITIPGQTFQTKRYTGRPTDSTHVTESDGGDCVKRGYAIVLKEFDSGL